MPDDLIGLGLYSPAEAARYARVRSAKLSRWLYGTSNSEPVFKPQLGELEGQRVVTFLDFAQTLSVNEIRIAGRIPLRKIKEAYRRAQEDYGVDYPFAFEHGVFAFGPLKTQPDKCELGIFLPRKGQADGEDYARKLAHQLTGKNKKNLLIWPIVKHFSAQLEFDASGMAAEYTAFEEHGYKIVMNPNVRFGKPYLADVGYQADSLAQAVEAEGSTKRVARLYHVDETAVKVAFDFYKLLNTTPKRPPPPKPLAA